MEEKTLLRKAHALLYKNDGGKVTVDWFCGGKRCLLSVVKHRGKFYSIAYDVASLNDEDAMTFYEKLIDRGVELKVVRVHHLMEISEEEAKRTLAGWSSHWGKAMCVWGWSEKERDEYMPKGVGG